MARKGIAATLASIALFTMLVIADSALMVGEGNLAATAQLTRLESHELVLGDSLMGEASLRVLAQSQAYLAGRPGDCSSLSQYLDGAAANASLAGDQGGINYSAAARSSRWEGGAMTDNLTVLSPFSGASASALNLRVSTIVSETGGGGTVSRTRDEAHLLHIPIEPVAASFLCDFTMGGLGRAFSGLSPCNATVAATEFSAVLPSLEGEARSLGFALDAGWSLSGCRVGYWFTLVEPRVAGVTGAFDWEVRGSGEAG